MNNLSKDEFNAEIEKGYKDMLEGRVEPAKKFFQIFVKEKKHSNHSSIIQDYFLSKENL